jgi:hypothetical protein
MNEFREKRKSDKRLEKEKAKREKTIAKARLRYEEKIKLAIDKSKNDIISRNNLQLARFERKQRRDAEKKARDILGKKQTQQTINSESVATRKKKALTQFQKRIRLRDTNFLGYVICRDTLEVRKRNDGVN